MIKALVFDFDGLIIDTETPSYHAFKEIFSEYNVELTLETYSQCIGTSFSVFNPYTYLSQCIGREINHEMIRNKFREIYKTLLEGEELRAGVVDYLETAISMGLKLGLASSSSLSWIQSHMDRFELNHYFSSIVTSDNVLKVKPDPELYTKSLTNLGVLACEAISFEDSLNGFIAAKTAGLNCVIVPNEVTKHFSFNNYDLLVNSIVTANT